MQPRVCPKFCENRGLRTKARWPGRRRCGNSSQEGRALAHSRHALNPDLPVRPPPPRQGPGCHVKTHSSRFAYEGVSPKKQTKLKVIIALMIEQSAARAQTRKEFSRFSQENATLNILEWPKDGGPQESFQSGRCQTRTVLRVFHM